MKLYLVLCSLVCLIYSTSCYKSSNYKLLAEWENFKLQHNKIYGKSENLDRMQIWMESKKTVEAHNLKFLAGKVSYEMGINKFSDLTAEEFISNYGMKQEDEKPMSDVEKRIVSKPTQPIADGIDWRKTGAVTPVKDQGNCGSCYAFSVTGAVEAQYFFATGKLYSLSEQQIVDCTKSFNSGCGGGYISQTFQFIANNGGLEAENSYPYTQFEQKCDFDVNYSVANIGGYYSVDTNEGALLNSVANYGPTSVSIYVPDSFQHYKSGVYDEPNCISKGKHAVLVVGYGNDGKNDFWLVKNSWGILWGEKGYIRMSRNKNNQCGIASQASVPYVGITTPAKNSVTVIDYFLRIVKTKSIITQTS